MKRMTAAVLGAVVMVASATAMAGGEPTVETGFKVVTGGTNLVSDAAFDLQNTVSGSSLTYKRQGSFGGINLGWNGTHGNYVTVKRQNGGGNVLYGEPVALKVRVGSDGNWLKYEHRDQGINLNWNKSPQYEWIIKGGTDGQPVKAGDTIAIVSTKENDSVIYCYRANGAWLKWSKDCSRAERELAKRNAPSR